jgi:type VI secretion system protein ImpC
VELFRLGFIPFVHRRGTNEIFCCGAPTLHRPQQFLESAATTEAALAARLPYVLVGARIVQYMLCMTRDVLGAFRGAAEIEHHLSQWLQRYVLTDPSSASEEERAAKPLLEAKVTVTPEPNRPGYHSVKLYVRPHYLLPVASPLRLRFAIASR